MKQKKQLGGTRPNAGRPKGEEKKALGKRVPLRFHKQLTEMVERELEKLIKKEKK